MASGSFKKVINSLGYELRVEWSSTPTVSSNSSTVKVTAKLYCPYRINIGGRQENKVVINGKNYYYNSSGIEGTGTFTLGSVTSSAITHNTDGSKSISISCSFALNASIDGSYVGTVTASDTVDLDDIPRASSVSVPDTNIGSAAKIAISRASSSFTHTLTYSFSGLTGTIATKTTNTSVSWTVPTSFYAKIPNAKSGTCTITCETFNGSTSVGKKTTTFKATAAESSCKPTLNPTVVDTGTVSISLTGDAQNTLIKGYNNMAVDSGAAARNSATLKSFKISCGGKSITTASGKLGYVTDDTFTFSVTDSRGYTTTATVEKNMINYSKVTCNLSNTKFTTDGVISFTLKGNFWKGNFGAVNNALEVKYKLYEQGGSGSWIATTPTISSTNTYRVDVSVSGLDYQKKYVLVAYAADACYRWANDDAVYTPQKVMSCVPVFDWGAKDFQFNVDVYMKENQHYKNGGTGIRGTTTGGVEVQAFSPCNANDNCVIGYGGYTEAVGGTNLYGNEVRIISNASVTVNGMEIAENKVLWNGAYYMSDTQSITLSEGVSKQANGIVLVFSRYDGGAVNESFSSHFVPKEAVRAHSGNGHNFNLCGMWANGMKYLYIKDTEITGHANNKGERTVGGITYNNSYYVLRYVIGV